MTVESLDTMIKAELGEWNRTPGRYRTRPSCQQLENKSEMAAFVMWLVDQTVAKSHASKADLDEVLVKNYIGGESKLIMELNAAMQEKPRDMHPKRISCLAALTTTSTPQTIVKASTADMQRMVDEDHFLLHLRSVEVDIKTTVLHSQRLGSWDATMYRKKTEWTQEQHARAKDAVELMFSKYTRFVNLEKHNTAVTVVTEYMKMESELVPVSGASAPVMMVLNWTAPCTIKSTNQELQKTLVGYLGTRQRFLGVMWSPTFNHSPCTLWMDQQRLEKDLAQANLNLDRKCMALYDCEGLDYRDRRPRFLEGRMLIPIAAVNKSVWQSTPFYRDAYITGCKWVHTKDLVVIEDCDFDDDMLPGSYTAPSSHASQIDLRGAQKYEQIGVDVCTKLLTVTLSALPVDLECSCILIDGHPAAGDLLESFLLHLIGNREVDKRACYVGLSPNPMHHDRLCKTQTEKLVSIVLSREIKLPGVEVQKDMNMADLDEAPKFPTLKELIRDTNNKVKLPAAVAKYLKMPEYGDRLAKLLDDSAEVLGYPVVPADDDEKRRAGNGMVQRMQNNQLQNVWP